MELKDPTPLGEDRDTKIKPTTAVLEEVQKKKKKTFRLPKISLPSFNSNKLPPQTVIVTNTPTLETTQPILKEQQRKENMKKIVDSFNVWMTTTAVPFLKKHQERIINISLIVVPLFLLIILFISIIAFTKTEPYRIAQEFLTKVENGDIQGAYALTTDAYQAVVSDKEFKKVVERLNSVDISNAKLVKKEITGKDKMGQYAYVQYKVSGYDLEFVLFNDARDWGILSIEFAIKQ